jgi:hypothetical protein
MKVKELLGRVTATLQDPEYVRWKKPELIEWFSEAQIAIAKTPGAYSKRAVVHLKEGTVQSLPADAWELLSITRNIDEDGVPLTPVRLTTRSLLDAYFPQWHMIAEKPLVENYIYDDRFPKEFSIYPPNDGTGAVEVVYAGIPAELTDEEDELVLDDSYAQALVNYALYRATSKESDYAPGAQNASAWYQSYLGEIQQNTQARGQATPSSALMPGQAVNANGGTE